jgi:exodeoxyribonuclease-3
MRLVTWNVNSLKARVDYVLDFLRTREPDILCVQELKLADSDFPYMAFESAGYTVAVHGQKSWNGVAVIARSPVTTLHSGLPGGEDLGARLITVEVDGLSVSSVYVPNGKTVDHPDFAMKLDWLGLLADYVEGIVGGDLPVVLAGDFNLCPADIDSYDPETFAGAIFHTGAERAAYNRLVDAGLVDIFRDTHPDVPGFSWWDYRAGHFHKGEGLRIDLLLAERSVAERVEDALVDRDFRKKREGITPSDHAPVIVDLA